MSHAIARTARAVPHSHRAPPVRPRSPTFTARTRPALTVLHRMTAPMPHSPAPFYAIAAHCPRPQPPLVFPPKF